MEATRAREVIAAEWEDACALLAGVSEPDLDRPTRCRGWDVRALTGHLLWGSSMEAEALERAAVRDATPAAGEEPGTVEAATASARLAARCARLVAALDALLADVREVGDGDTRTVPLLAGPVPLPVALDILAMEAGAHTDDLRDALDARSELTTDVAAATFRVLGPYLPVAAATAARVPERPVTVRYEGTSGAIAHRFDGEAWSYDAGASSTPSTSEVVTIAGPDEVLALLLLGRTDARDPRLRVTGDVALADQLDVWLPGP